MMTITFVCNESSSVQIPHHYQTFFNGMFAFCPKGVSDGRITGTDVDFVMQICNCVSV